MSPTPWFIWRACRSMRSPVHDRHGDQDAVYRARLGHFPLTWKRHQPCPYQKLHPPQFQVAPLQRLLVRVRESHDSSRQAEIRGLLRRTRSVFWILYSNYFGIALPVIVREGIIAREVVI